MDQIELINFRNHKNLKVELGSCTAIIGPNGSGKTSILEAISLLSVTSSWKADRDVEVVQWEEPFSRVVSGPRELVIQRNPAYKRYRIDGVSKRLTEVLGSLPTTIFQPDDTELVYGSPAYRRKTIDRLLSQVVPGYARALITLQKVLKQRNQLLKRIQEGEASEDELVYWDEELGKVTELIQGARQQLAASMEERVAAHFASLMPEGREVLVHYHSSPTHLVGATLAEHLAANRVKEISAGSTLYGPHREDLLFTYGGHPAEAGMSRGQSRALVLAVKFFEVKYLEEKTEQQPLLLLDDIFAEFDATRRQRILDLCSSYQTILTATELPEVSGATCIELS